MTIASIRSQMYCQPVAANSAADLGRSNISRRISAPISAAGAFFVPVVSCYGGCAWDTFGCAGCLESRSANPRTAVTNPCLAASGGSSSTLGALLMKHAHNPSSDRAAAHRAMALSALHSNSSLSVRLKRYNSHMTKARSLEVGGAK